MIAWLRWWLAYRRAIYRAARTVSHDGKPLAVAVALQDLDRVWYRRP